MLTLIPLLFFLSSGSGISTLSCSSPPSLTTMALTLEDFIRISDKNRADDLKEINKMIESGVRAEVERVVNPMQTRNEERFGLLESEMSKLKDIMIGPSLLPQADQGNKHLDHVARNDQPNQRDVGPVHETSDSDKVQEALKRAKKIISLQPIDKKKDVDRQFRMHEDITSDDQAMKAAVIEFIECEMKCRNIPNIVNVFPPANTPEYDRLYVEFEDEASVLHVSSFARVFRKPDRQISLYVPRNFQPRFRAFNEQARTIRTAPGLSPGEVKTKVKYGFNDFVLLSKPRNGHWTPVRLETENFPPLLPPPGPAQFSGSPPPGRPRGSPTAQSSGSPPPGRPRGSPPVVSPSSQGEASPAPSPPKQRGSPSRPPNSSNNPNKRGASSPLESGAKVTKPSEPPTLPQSCNERESSPSLPPATPPFTPSLVAQQDNGQFAQTAVCSPLVSTNKHFTFDTRRMSLPASATQSKSLN